MPGQVYFLAIGALGVTLAGFAGLIVALQGRAGLMPEVVGWRIRNVVAIGFGTTIVGFGTVALYTLTRDVTLTVRLASVLLLLTRAAQWREYRPSAAWRDERQRRSAIFIQAAFVTAVALNIALASVGYLQLLLLISVTGAMGVFALAVRDVSHGSGHSTSDTEEAEP